MLKKKMCKPAVLLFVVILSIHSPTWAMQDPPDSLIYKDVFPILSRDITSNDFSDLMPLKEKIGDSRIVLLGEESHGGASTFLMKGRLIRFLHEEMGFNILAWESGISCVGFADEAIKDETIPPLIAGNRGIFGVWLLAEELKPLMQYLRQTKSTDNPIVNVGFDCQFSATYCNSHFTEEIVKFFNVIEPGFVDTIKTDELHGYCINLYNYREDTGILNRIVELMDEFLQLSHDYESELAQHHSTKQIAMFRMYLIALKDYAQCYLDYENYSTTRDKSMARLFIFLAKEIYPDEKIMIWAHTYHNLRNRDHIQNSYLADQTYTMGEGIYEEFGDQTYNIGFIYYEGEVMDNPFRNLIPLDPAMEGSIEWMLRLVSNHSFFLDLKNLPANHWLRTNILPSRIIGQYFYSARWPKIFDGIVYMPIATPKTRASQF